MIKAKFTAGDHLYLQVSEGIEKMIASDVLRIGDRLPSVRVLSSEYGISTGTVFQAYYHLEGKGLIESRPKSGYYVRFTHRHFPGLPAATQQEAALHEVSVTEMIESIYHDIASAGEMNFALAVPDASLLPAARITKSATYALRNTTDHCMSYEVAGGNMNLRKEIAKLCFNWGGKIKPEDIIITSGCIEAITMCLRAVTEYGDTVVIERPTYFGISQAIESLGLKALEVSCDPETGINPDALQRAIKKYSVSACVLIPNFNNPLGSCMPEENKKRIVEMLAQKNIPLIEDDIYGELYFGRSRPGTCKRYDKKGLVMHCSSLSKSLSPGYRVGWAIPGKFFDRVNRAKRVSNISSPTIVQATMAHFLKHGRFEYHLKTLRKALYTQSLRYMQAIIEYFPADTKVSRPQGGFIMWLQLNKKVNAFKLRAEAMKHQIYIVPGKIFSSGGEYGNYIRLSFGRPWSDETEYGIMMLGRFVKKML